jgi:3-oxoadipate enol-lactonase
MWDSVAPVLADNFSVITFDNRGLGESIARQPARNLRHLAADMVELLDYLQLDRVHVLGLSLGGIIAQRFAMDHGPRIDRLVLMSCSDQFTPYLRQITLMLAHALRRFPKEEFVRTIELLGTAPPFLDAHASEIEKQIRAKCECAPSRGAVAAQLRCLAASDPDPCVPITDIPTLVVAGEHDALVPNYYARQMASRIPGSEFHVIAGAGHNPFYECPGRVLPLIVRFLGSGRGLGTRFASTFMDVIDAVSSDRDGVLLRNGAS